MNIEEIRKLSDMEILHVIAHGNDIDSRYAKLVLEYRVYRSAKMLNICLMIISFMVAITGLVELLANHENIMKLINCFYDKLFR